MDQKILQRSKSLPLLRDPSFHEVRPGNSNRPSWHPLVQRTFMDLPAELRLSVYSYATSSLGNTGMLFLRNHHSRSLSAKDVPKPAVWPVTLLLSNKQICNEAYEILLSNAQIGVFPSASSAVFHALTYSELGSIRRLGIAWHHMRHHDSLIRARTLPRLEELYILLCELNTEGIEDIFEECGGFQALKKLEVEYPFLEQETLEWQNKEKTSDSGYALWRVQVRWYKEGKAALERLPQKLREESEHED